VNEPTVRTDSATVDPIDELKPSMFKFNGAKKGLKPEDLK